MSVGKFSGHRWNRVAACSSAVAHENPKADYFVRAQGQQHLCANEEVVLGKISTIDKAIVRASPSILYSLSNQRICSGYHDRDLIGSHLLNFVIPLICWLDLSGAPVV